MTYWEKRGAQLEQLADKRTRATAQKVAHLYDEALERIEAKIQKIYTTFTGNSHISEAEATRLMSVKQTKEARRELEELLERTAEQTLRQELITQLNAPAYGYRIAALEALRDQVYFEAKAIGNDSVTYTESRLKDLYDLGYYRTAFDLSQYEGVNVPFSQLSGGRVEAAINAYWTPDVDTLAGNYSTRIWADTTQLAENVRDIVTRGLMTGGNYADMAAELAAQMGDVQFTKKVEADGSTRTVATGSGAKYRATRLIRTEGNYITGQAKLQSMRDAGYEKYEFICLLETRTCSVCGGLDGKQFPVEEAQPGVNMNPMHPNCRCFVSPVVSRRLMEAGTRGAQVDASGRKETVPASMTYQEWYEKYVKGNPEMLTAQKMLKNKASDQRQFESYRQILGEDAPKTFAEFQDLKYNDSEGWARLKRERVTISKIDSSNWSDEFKDKAKSLYYQFREDDIEIGYHAIGRFFSRQTDRQGNKVFDYADIRDIYRKAANYVQPDSRLVHYYNSIAVIVDNETAEIITIVCRRHPKADWRGFGD